MSSVNVLVLTGNFGKDPEIRVFESGNCLAEFSIAVESFSKGEKKTEWFECKAWGKTAEIIDKCCRKGSKVGLTGQLKKETWVDKESGKERYKYVPTFNQIALLGSKQDTESQPRPPAPEAKSVGAAAPDFNEIPF